MFTPLVFDSSATVASSALSVLCRTLLPTTAAIVAVTDCTAAVTL